MQYIVIFGCFYMILVFTDLIPAIRAKNKKLLRLYIPVYAVTLGANILYGMSFHFTSIAAFFEGFMWSLMN